MQSGNLTHTDSTARLKGLLFRLLQRLHLLMPVPRRYIPLLISIAVLLLFWRITYRDSPTLVQLSTNANAAMGSAQPPLRLAILETDTPQPNTNTKYGGYRGVFTALLTAAAQTLDPPQELSSIVSISAHDVVHDLDSYPNLEDIDALLLTGSKHNSFDDEPWILKLVEYTKKAIDSGRVKTIGVCFGHQIIGRAVGAGVGQSDKGWEVAVTEVDLTEKGKEIFQTDKLRIQQMHRDIVHKFPSDAIALGSNDVCTVQAMYSPGKYISVQGHPEFTEEIVTEILANRHKAGVFNDAMYKETLTRAGLPHDGLNIARAFFKFIREG